MTRRKFSIRALALGAVAALASLLPATAWAVEGYATANVNMRSGPSTRYPAVTVIPYGTSVEIHGCLSDVPWCDVSFYNGRGWVAGRYVQAEYRSNRVYVEPSYYDNLGIPIVTFEVGTYWDRYYRNRSFYRERDYWRGGYNGDNDRGRRDNNYQRRRDSDYGRPRRDNNNDDIYIGRPRRDNDNNFERPRRDRDRDQFDNRRGESDRDIRARENRRERERDRAERRERNRDSDQFRDDNRRNERRNSDRRREFENRDNFDNNRGRDRGGNERVRRCRPGDENCT
ncbi:MULTISPECIES: SH3 domain-containing protein [unclassified Rhizobium]|uniref:SH3 domain-containing protein n=1 Tax=unclassified Rhizobium TaxID=2613769 RepID=UPI0007160CA7|nr:MULTISPECIES: SH3 domain-containing protein [unclassified Rhizobium]KQS96471.1 hypothetical protein ASG50_05325 [Rhizobium sp. Leaf386]KQT06310.1 hypothetical protein ASG42_01570 [Rhizobium sp. Leaf391]KQU09454.1 hypothetical protein ASG68_00050 [Rhizobium sp. Leaf453]